MDLRGPISGETGYVIVWFSHCHPQESVLWELRRRDCESPSHWICPASQLAVKSNNDCDLTPTLIASGLITAGSLCASANVCVSVCVCVLSSGNTPEIPFVFVLKVVSVCWKCMWSTILSSNPTVRKWEKEQIQAMELMYSKTRLTLMSLRPHLLTACLFHHSSFPKHLNYSQVDGLTLQMWG